MRLFYFIPLATILTSVNLLIIGWVMNGSTGTEVLAQVELLTIVAILVMPYTLPGALVAWVLARWICCKLAVPTYRGAIISGVISGFGAMGALIIFDESSIRGLTAAMLLGLPAAIAGGIAAAIVYWPDWGDLGYSD